MANATTTPSTDVSNEGEFSVPTFPWSEFVDWIKYRAGLAGQHSLGYRIADSAARALGLCEYGRGERPWSLRLAEYFFVDCICCYFYRAIAIGHATGVFTWLPAGIALGWYLFR